MGEARVPLIFRDALRPAGVPRIHLIGLELRVRDSMIGRQEEIRMVELDIDVPAPQYWGQYEFGPLTLHTSGGDVQIAQVPITVNGM